MVPNTTPIMENQMEKKMENEMEAGIIYSISWAGALNLQSSSFLHSLDAVAYAKTDLFFGSCVYTITLENVVSLRYTVPFRSN